MDAYEFLKQYLTEEQNGYLQSGRLREKVAMRELTVLNLDSHFRYMYNQKNEKKCILSMKMCGLDSAHRKFNIRTILNRLPFYIQQAQLKEQQNQPKYKSVSL